MQYGIVFPNVGAYSDVRVLVDLASQAEEAGWDGVFLWDTLHYHAENKPISDPWIALAAVAMKTERVKIGLQVAVPPRRRPWKLAREAVTLDHLSNGRFILGVGIGESADEAIVAFGEEQDAKKRARMLDESLEILRGLWSGKPFSYNGEHYRVNEITFLPEPVQKPGIPIWIGWSWPKKKPIERAARFDGACPFSANNGGKLTSIEIQQLKAGIQKYRTTAAPFDVVTVGPNFDAVYNEQALAVLTANASAGATWSLQYVMPEDDRDRIQSSIQKGPPSL